MRLTLTIQGDASGAQIDAVRKHFKDKLSLPDEKPFEFEKVIFIPSDSLLVTMRIEMQDLANFEPARCYGAASTFVGADRMSVEWTPRAPNVIALKQLA